MKSIMICITVTITLINSRFSYSQEISQKDVVKIAEEFVERNGYTKKPIDTSQYKLSYTMQDGFNIAYMHYTIDSIIRHRYNTLYPKAFCINYYYDFKEWHVGFISTAYKPNELNSAQKNSDLSGEVVIINRKGDSVRLAHKTAFFSKFKKL